MEAVGDPPPHIIVGPAAGEDHSRVHAQPLGMEAQIIGVNADAVAADEAWLDGGNSTWSGRRRASHTDTPLAQYLEPPRSSKAMLMSRWAFSIALAASAVRIEQLEHPRLGHCPIEMLQLVENLFVLAGDHLDDLVDPMDPVTD